MPKRICELNTDLSAAVSFALREITHICRDMKNRSPGSESEREAVEYMVASLKKHCGRTDIKVETFKAHSPEGQPTIVWKGEVYDGSRDNCTLLGLTLTYCMRHSENRIGRKEFETIKLQ